MQEAKGLADMLDEVRSAMLGCTVPRATAALQSSMTCLACFCSAPCGPVPCIEGFPISAKGLFLGHLGAPYKPMQQLALPVGTPFHRALQLSRVRRRRVAILVTMLCGWR